MHYTYSFASPLGEMLLAADDTALTGVWFVGQRYFAQSLPSARENKETPILQAAKRWLALYFAGRKADFCLPIRPGGSAFQREVWAILRTVSYGQTVTYGEIAAALSAQHGGKKVSAQAVGGAVGHNPISILVPCHRVLGAGGNLTGYAGGIERKLALLQREGIDTAALRRPR